jgi:predicted nucleic acid-binding protein
MIALVDTSIWSLALRRNRDDLNRLERASVNALDELVRAGRARMIGPVRQELLSGIPNPSKFEKIRIALRPFADEPLDMLDYEAAAKANNECRTKGVAVTAVDILLCAVAMRRDWAIFATDPDFAHYAKLLPLKLYAPGS